GDRSTRARCGSRSDRMVGRQRMDARGWGSSTVAEGRGRLFTPGVLAATGSLMLAAGIWGLVAPRSFAEFVAFPYNRHFLHDAGAFQIGIGVPLVLASAGACAPP